MLRSEQNKSHTDAASSVFLISDMHKEHDVLISYEFHIGCYAFVSHSLGYAQIMTCAFRSDTSLVSLVLLDLLPELGVLLNADLLGSVELVEAAEVHVLGEQRNHVLVESLPVRVLEVVPTAWC